MAALIPPQAALIPSRSLRPEHARLSEMGIPLFSLSVGCGEGGTPPVPLDRSGATRSPDPTHGCPSEGQTPPREGCVGIRVGSSGQIPAAGRYLRLERKGERNTCRWDWWRFGGGSRCEKRGGRRAQMPSHPPFFSGGMGRTDPPNPTPAHHELVRYCFGACTLARLTLNRARSAWAHYKPTRFRSAPPRVVSRLAYRPCEQSAAQSTVATPSTMPAVCASTPIESLTTRSAPSETRPWSWSGERRTGWATRDWEPS
jgi:hypothetical protein